MSLETLLCDVDDFCHCFLNQWYAQQLNQGKRKRLRASRLSVSEIMTILIHFHQSQYRHFKGYYPGCLTNLSSAGYQIASNPEEVSHSAPENQRRLSWRVYNFVKNAPGLDQFLQKGGIV
jgi:hypothetical protein